MESLKLFSVSLKPILSLLLLALALTYSTSARMLDEEETSLPATGANAGSAAVATAANPGPVAAASAVNPGVAAAATVANPGSSAAATAANSGPAAAAVTDDPHHPLVFFMHDILGGSNPSARAVTGIVTNAAVNGQVPFAKPNGANIPINTGVPQDNNNNGLINNNNIPFLTGLGGNTAPILNSNNNNQFNGAFNNLAVLNGGQLPGGAILQKLMFGTLTVIDDELTEGHELGSGLVGKAQGFYIASSVDGTSQTLAFTVMFENGGYEDTISFFGVHRTAVSESQVAVMGGTGKFVNAKGFATIKTFSANTQHETDGFETLLQFTVYLAY